jgi:hypothetical protein
VLRFAAATVGYYADIPTTPVHLLEDLTDYLKPYDTYMPRIVDPTCPEVDYNHRWNNEQYLNFRDRISGYAAKAREALDEPDSQKRLDLWRELFGPEFGSTTETLAASQTASRGDPGEMFIENKHTVDIGPYTFRVTAYAVKQNGFRHGPMSSMGNRIRRGRTIRFEIDRCTVPEPYEVLGRSRTVAARRARPTACAVTSSPAGEAHKLTRSRLDIAANTTWRPTSSRTASALP